MILKNNVLYFAYGSNMSIRRMLKRNINFHSVNPYTLNGYRLIINKKSYKDSELGYANIIKDKSSYVEGVLYEIDECDLKKLDVFEGFPKYYNRITIIDNNLELVVYIATEEWTSDVELKTSKKYKEYLLESKNFVSNDYYNKILKFKI